MSTYWNAHPTFVHNPTAPLHQEFKRLAEQCGWSRKGTQYKREWERCGREEFSHHFGRDDNRLAGWQAMCATAGVKEAPESIKQCKQVLHASVWINIFDLLDAKRTGKPVKKHASLKALREYTKRTNKIFPKKAAKENQFLKVLLREIF
ncbi:hypothetical protein B0H12DRAFT_1028383 [Mycena haematopus]|nr:hypothetical protein B0H12DRAFT_1029022 [Mycena haematopus]KAJ7233616.1 hypothetical protein B0H12DRAFT_1028383 [Mycena haematopus]